MRIRVFFDSDVIISSLLSSKGAGYALLHERLFIEPMVTNLSLEEISDAATELGTDGRAWL